VRRTYLDKEDGTKRPIGIPAFEDKIVQRAVVMLLGAIYEQDFKDGSYGFREGRSPHQALHALREQCLEQGLGWIVDADVSAYVDSLDHQQLLEIIQRRVKDGSLLCLIEQWLKAGVMEEGSLSYPERGSPQGGVISPLAANIYLHHVLDEWYEGEVQPRLKGRSILIRLADDFVIACEREDDARRVLAVLPKRFGRFGLTIHPTKTRLVKFTKPGRHDQSDGGNGTFDFLGLTHYWAKSRRGYWVIKRMTARKRQRRAMRTAWEWCRKHRHQPLKEQYQALVQKLRGHYQYYGVRGNYRKLWGLWRWVERAWSYWLKRRSQRAISAEKFAKLRAQYPLPIPVITQSI